MIQDSLIFLEQKKISGIQVRLNIQNINKNLVSHFAFGKRVGKFILGKYLSHILEITINDPWTNPNMMKVQFAPCQNPMMVNAAKLLNNIRGNETLLPPIGI